MDEKKILAGIGVVVVGLFLIAVLRGDPEKPVDVKAMIAQELAPVNDAVAALDTKISGVQGALDTLSAQSSDAVARADLDSVQSSIDEVSQQSGALSAQLDDLRQSVEQVKSEAQQAQVQAAPSAPAPAAAPEAAETTANPQASVADAGPDGLTPGQTAVFADGGLRVFVSMLDRDAGKARIMIDGKMKTFATGDARTVAAGGDYCRITLDGVSGSGAQLSGICGSDLPAPEGISAGNTAVFQDGALRVFASRINEDTARLSINGALMSLALGRSAPVMVGEEKCRVFVDALDRGHAQVSAACGEDVKVSDPVAPGSTAVLGDGAARVFLASVSEDGLARFAVNGLTLKAAKAGEQVQLEDNCSVTLEDVVEATVSFSYACD